MLTANLMSKAMRLAPAVGSRTHPLAFSSPLRPLRVPTRTVKTAAAQQNHANDDTQVPVQQQHAQQQGGGAQPGLARQAPRQQAQQQPLLGRRLQVQPLSAAALSPFADVASVAPGFGRVGGFLRSIEDEMDSMMRALEFGDNMTGGTLTSSDNAQQDFAAPLHVDVHELDREIVLKADTPGMTGADVKVTYEPEARMLAISGERSSERSDKDDTGRFTRYERRFGSFHRRFKLPQNVDTSAISAKVTNGELEIHVPKTEEASKQQEIKVQ